MKDEKCGIIHFVSVLTKGSSRVQKQPVSWWKPIKFSSFCSSNRNLNFNANWDFDAQVPGYYVIICPPRTVFKFVFVRGSSEFGGRLAVWNTALRGPVSHRFAGMGLLWHPSPDGGISSIWGAWDRCSLGGHLVHSCDWNHGQQESENIIIKNVDPNGAILEDTVNLFQVWEDSEGV